MNEDEDAARERVIMQGMVEAVHAAAIGVMVRDARKALFWTWAMRLLVLANVGLGAWNAAHFGEPSAWFSLVIIPLQTWGAWHAFNAAERTAEFRRGVLGCIARARQQIGCIQITEIKTHE